MNITINHIDKSYEGKIVLEDLCAELSEGKWNLIEGVSGSGKTTLLRILMGLEKPDSGTITGMPGAFSVLFQEDRLCLGLSALKNASLAMKNASSDQMQKTAAQHLAEVGLEKAMHQPAKELSGGMRRRLALVRAVLADESLIILDEPFQGLDESTAQNVIRYLKNHTVGKTLILVTHERTDLLDEDIHRIVISGEK